MMQAGSLHPDESFVKHAIKQQNPQPPYPVSTARSKLQGIPLYLNIVYSQNGIGNYLHYKYWYFRYSALSNTYSVTPRLPVEFTSCFTKNFVWVMNDLDGFRIWAQVVALAL